MMQSSQLKLNEIYHAHPAIYCPSVGTRFIASVGWGGAGTSPWPLTSLFRKDLSFHMSSARHHTEWVSLIEVSGPFLSMPVLLRVFPQGLDAAAPDLNSILRPAYEEW